MALRERRQTAGRKAAAQKAERTIREAEAAKNRAGGRTQRRNPEDPKVVRERARINYRRKHPKKASKIKNGLLCDGEQKEVRVLATDELKNLEVYNMAAASEALGRTRPTINKWLKDKMIPPPCLAYSSGSRVVYCREELQTLANILVDHEKQYDYLHHVHDVTINRIWQEIGALRRRMGLTEEDDDA